jgi:hypothetical protein
MKTLTTKIIFNIPVPVKNAAMRRAKREGITLSNVLAHAARAYGKGELHIDIVDRPLRPSVSRALRKASEEARRGVNVSPKFTKMEDAIRWLKLQ